MIESIRDVAAGREHEYLTTPTFLFEFAVDDGPPRVSSRDLQVTHYKYVPGGAQIFASSHADQLSFKLDVAAPSSSPAVVLALTITSRRRDSSVFLRMVMPKLLGLRGRGSVLDTLGMVPIEIGSNVRLVNTWIGNGRLDVFDGRFNPGTVGMPYRAHAKRIGLPTSMNTMELASFHDATGGGLFVADIDHAVEDGVAPIQLTLSLVGVEGFWVSELRPLDPVSLPRLAIGVHPDGDWHEAVDYYLAEHRSQRNWRFPTPPAWFRDEATIYTHSGGGAGGMYLVNTIENLPDGSIATYFEVDHKWPPVGPIPITQAGLAAAGAPLAVAVRQGKDEDVFVVDDGGAIAWTSMRDNGQWSSPAARITVRDFAPPGAPLAAVARHEHQIDLFAVGGDGALRTAYGPATDAASWREADLSTPGIFPPAAPVAAITRAERDVDVFAIDLRDALHWTYERGNGPWLPTTRPITHDKTCVAGGHLAALARNPVQTDVFSVDAGGALTTIYKNLTFARRCVVDREPGATGLLARRRGCGDRTRGQGRRRLRRRRRGRGSARIYA